MVSNTIQCEFESHPGHAVGGFPKTAVMYSSRERSDVLRLLDSGLSLSEVGRRTGVSRSTARTWRERRDLGDAECPTCDGACVSGPAYAALLGFYLGDGCVSKQRGYYSLRISCDETYPHIVCDVTEQICQIRPSHAVFHVKAPGTVVVHANWKHWPCLFPQHGPGRKHERPDRAGGLAAGDRRAAPERVPAGTLPLRRVPDPQLGVPSGRWRGEAVRISTLGVRQPVHRHHRPVLLGARPGRRRLPRAAGRSGSRLAPRSSGPARRPDRREGLRSLSGSSGTPERPR